MLVLVLEGDSVDEHEEDKDSSRSMDMGDILQAVAVAVVRWS